MIPTDKGVKMAEAIINEENEGQGPDEEEEEEFNFD